MLNVTITDLTLKTKEEICCQPMKGVDKKYKTCYEIKLK